MEESTRIKESNTIQTFVFMDLESSGLRNKPKIVELSMLAVSRDHLLEMSNSTKPSSTLLDSSQQPSVGKYTNGVDTLIPQLPRVIHKYTRLYYPFRTITSEVEKINGLNNELLEHLPEFNKANAEALALFLDLPKPVSLVAHNGTRFDFPLLKAELKGVDCLDNFQDMLCIDTLTAIKDIDALQEKEDIEAITKIAESFNMDDLDDEFLEEALPPRKKFQSEESKEERLSQVPRGPSQPHESSPQAFQRCGVSPLASPPMTPVKSHVPIHSSTPATPVKPAQPPPLPITPEIAQPATPGASGFCSKALKGSNTVRRTLTYEKNNKRKSVGRVLYNQPDIYKRLFSIDYPAHRAESDCQALLEICGHYGGRFVEWADTFAVKFCRFEPLWVSRKSFSLT